MKNETKEEQITDSSIDILELKGASGVMYLFRSVLPESEEEIPKIYCIAIRNKFFDHPGLIPVAIGYTANCYKLIHDCTDLLKTDFKYFTTCSRGTIDSMRKILNDIKSNTHDYPNISVIES